MIMVGQTEPENIVKDCREILAEAKANDSDHIGIRTADLEKLLNLADSSVNTPSHYMHGDIETIDIIRLVLSDEEFAGYCKGNIIKYRERAQFKGNPDKDYAKAKWYFYEVING